MLVFSACSSNKLNCSKFFSYQQKKVDVKGISFKLKKQGIDIGELAVGEISIDPKFVIASNKLQELDLLQYSMCGQIKGLSQKDTLRKNLIKEYGKTLINMLQIAQNPDSLLDQKVFKLEQSESVRSANEKINELLKSTPPKVEGNLISLSGTPNIKIDFLNNVPITFDFYVNQYESNIGVGSFHLIERPKLYPLDSRKTFYTKALFNFSDLPAGVKSLVTLHFHYESIFYLETRNAALKFSIEKSYEIDPELQLISFIKKKVIKYQ